MAIRGCLFRYSTLMPTLTESCRYPKYDSLITSITAYDCRSDAISSSWTPEMRQRWPPSSVPPRSI